MLQYITKIKHSCEYVHKTGNIFVNNLVKSCKYSIKYLTKPVLREKSFFNISIIKHKKRLYSQKKHLKIDSRAFCKLSTRLVLVSFLSIDSTSKGLLKFCLFCLYKTIDRLLTEYQQFCQVHFKVAVAGILQPIIE